MQLCHINLINVYFYSTYTAIHLLLKMLPDNNNIYGIHKVKTQEKNFVVNNNKRILLTIAMKLSKFFILILLKNLKIKK